MARTYDTYTSGTVLTSMVNAHSLTRGDSIVMPMFLGRPGDVVTVRGYQMQKGSKSGRADLRVADRIGEFTFPVRVNDPIPRVVGSRSCG